MDRRYTCFKEEKDKDFNIAAQRSYVETKPELDKFLEQLIDPVVKTDKSVRILDACCGLGHLIYSLSETMPNASFLGVDQTPYLIKEARELNRARANVSFEVGDIYDLPAKYPKGFDFSINW